MEREKAMTLELLPSNTKEGQLKSHVLLMSRVLEDTGIRCCTSTTNDLNTIVRRVDTEGLSFLTITLPSFGKDFERCLDRGSVDSALFTSFAKRGAWLPALLQGYTSQVFDQYTGDLLEEPSIDAIQAVRQISYLFKKLERPCTEARVKAAFVKFLECDDQVRLWEQQASTPQKLREFERATTLVLGKVLTEVNQQVYDYDIRPNHGPGATADRLKANGKWTNRVWTSRLEKAGLLASDFLYPSVSHFLADPVGPTWLEPEAEIPVRVVSVPKTLKTPRIIAIEPTHMQFVQQGLKDALVGAIEQDNNLRDVIGFRDQNLNHTMACHGSAVQDLATLDLSEASDRVSNLLVRSMLSRYSFLLESVMSSRSYRADVPGYGVHHLAKFASMGSALTFPVEAMVFCTLVFMGIARGLKSQLTPKILSDYRRSVRVYGDDLIVPVNFVHPVIETLEAYGLKVNQDKSFWTGKFRESCGKDYYDGQDVSVVKVGKDIPTRRQDAREIVATVELRNHMYFSGYWRTAAYLDEMLGKVIPMPIVETTSPGLGRHSYLSWEAERECPYLQRPLVRAAVLKSTPPVSMLDGAGALLKFFLKRIDEPYELKHLERAGRPEFVNIKTRWVPPY